MMKAMAIGILSVMITGAFAWGGAQIFDNSLNIVRLDEREKSTKEILIKNSATLKENGAKLDAINKFLREKTR